MRDAARFDAIISGRATDAAAVLLRPILAGLSLPWRGVIATRNLWYDRITSASTAVDAPVISVGNITTGGTGKTPMVAWIATALRTHKRRVGILMRGYGARPGDAQTPRSDEAMLLERLCPDARVIVHPDRIAGAREAIAAGADTLVLDDGFQHRRLRRDLDIVLLDATRPFGYGRMLPRGALREPAAALRRAGVVIMTRADQLAPAARESLRQELKRLAPHRPVLLCRHAFGGFVDVAGGAAAPRKTASMRALLFAGIANFASFVRSVEEMEVTIAGAYEFPDHHPYSTDEIAKLASAADACDAAVAVTTEKDAVKLQGRWPETARPLICPRVAIEFESDHEAVFRELLHQTIRER